MLSPQFVTPTGAGAGGVGCTAGVGAGGVTGAGGTSSFTACNLLICVTFGLGVSAVAFGYGGFNTKIKATTKQIRKTRISPPLLVGTPPQ